MLRIIGNKTRGQLEQEWAAAIKTVAKNGSQPKGDGWMTIHEIREAHGLSEVKARDALMKLRKSNRAEMFRGAVVLDGGKTIPRVWYRLKP